jgi:Na+-driven multidrug efflux pump
MRFTMYVGLVSMWSVSVGGAWLLGIRLQLGLVGIWIAMACDEWLRGAVILWRWQSGAWKQRRLIPIEAETRTQLPEEGLEGC